MKKIKIMAALAVVATAVVITGCSKKETDVTSETRLVEWEGQSEKATSQVEEKESPATEVLATIQVSFAYKEGIPDTIEVLDIADVSGKPDDKNRNVIRGYAKDGKLVYTREDKGVTDDKGVLNVTITYEFYSLDYDFDYRFEPMEPENGGDIQTLKGSYSQKGGASKDLTFENAGIRGQTGIWYAGICSCRKGVLGDYSTN